MKAFLNKKILACILILAALLCLCVAAYAAESDSNGAPCEPSPVESLPPLAGVAT